MKGSIKIYFLIFIFFILSTYNVKYDNYNFNFFPIKEIIIQNAIAVNLPELKSNFNFLLNSSLLFLNEEKISKIVSEHEFISSIKIKKKFPNVLKVRITEKIPVATQIIDKKKFYITKYNEKINFVDLKFYENLPLIFGKNKNFNIFYGDLEKNDFEISEIKAFYYFEIGRWDIVLKNKKVIKLPKKNYLGLFPKINLMIKDSKFSKFTIFDFRIQDQLILQ